jgi:hypothetical protein
VWNFERAASDTHAGLSFVSDSLANRYNKGRIPQVDSTANATDSNGHSMLNVSPKNLCFPFPFFSFMIKGFRRAEPPGCDHI